ncbi:uncharacterized protein LOC141631523 [Silene latifolia]|uniref:uncharacterized protein LOC141631523 n=1 Tax=Silene latifolia TaxID=37657 RepID=UPI003D782D1F
MGWRLSVDGSFSIKSAAWLVQGVFNYNDRISPYAWIWKCDLPPKIKFFLWKTCVDGLPTKERLQRYHVHVPLHCILCNHHTEDRDHFFFNYPILHNVCQAIGVGDLVSFFHRQRNDQPLSFIEKLNAFKDYFPQFRDLDNQDTCPCRRDYCHKKCIDNIVCEKLPESFIKINFDGSKRDNNNAALGYSIRNHHGNILLLGAKSCGNVNVLLAETLALRESIIAAKSLGYMSIAIERDNLCVINSMRGSWKIPWEISSLIADI